MPTLATIRADMRTGTLKNESKALSELITLAALDAKDCSAISARAVTLVKDIRKRGSSGLMEPFLAEYGLTTNEGVALMCLAEALLRVPDTSTIDALIEDKIAPSDWGKHLGRSSSSLVNASTWALMLTGKVLDAKQPGLAGVLTGTVKRLGEPVIRTAVAQAMREMGRQFVLGRDISEAMNRAAGREAKGFTYSYDMLGEAALTDEDARRYHLAYERAIKAIAENCDSDDIRKNPGISIKLSALYPRYESVQHAKVLEVLVPRVTALAQAAKTDGMGLNIDAEEADRLDLSLDVIEAVLADEALAGWDGFGVVVQAYGRRAPQVIDWLYALAQKHQRRLMVRLVKGAYWDSEIKQAQVLGIPDYPVFTRKPSTDLSYIANARKLLGMTDRIYPQFATHNAHTVAAILHMATDNTAFEFQRLHGMGEALHDLVLEQHGTGCRIYAPVGPHRDLLAYLVRRLLENGANSSFVNQIVDEAVPPELVAADPFSEVETFLNAPENPATPLPPAIYGADRINAEGWNLNDPVDAAAFEAARAPFATHQWEATPRIAGTVVGAERQKVENPANPNDQLGFVTDASEEDVETALAAAKPWDADKDQRRTILLKAADLYEANAGEFFTLAAREAGKNPFDAVAELREAVDFLRYYANQALTLDTPARGVFACISPWNFPLAIFTGQISAALAAGNAVLAKPAETTPLIATKAIDLLLEAGVPPTALQCLPGAGSVVGAKLSSDPRVDGLCFTGSTVTAQHINKAMAENLAPDAPLIAETGGLNAMIVDSTALPEQAIRDIVASSFQSAGQRCSALRMLYLQEDIAQPFLKMLYGAMDALNIGDPWALSIDVGPVIDTAAQTKINTHIDQAEADGRVLHRCAVPQQGYFVSPTVIKLNGIVELKEEIFGPVLHVATFAAGEIDRIVDDINKTGYGLTFGLHTRVDDRVQSILSRLHVGNAYVNRNQIGAIVGSQPFGGEGLSGTGPKAGGPAYVPRFTRHQNGTATAATGTIAPTEQVQQAINALDRPSNDTALSRTSMPGVTGESNRLSVHPRGLVLCLGPGLDAARQQAAIARTEGCTALVIAPGSEVDGLLSPEALADLHGFDAVTFWGSDEDARALRKVLAARPGPLLPLITEAAYLARYHIERHLCINTTAAGGNTQLLASA